MVQLSERPATSEKKPASPAYPVGWFSTGRDAAARNLLRAVYEKRHELGVYIPFVFCNYNRGEGAGDRDYADRREFFDLVDDYGIPLVAVPWKPFAGQYGTKWRDAYGKAIESALRGLPDNLDVLAGFMLWVPDNVCQERKMLNLHPALPDGPKGTWQQVIWQLMEEDAKETGIMFHRVTKDLDRGPPVTFSRFPVRGVPYDRHWQDYRGQRSSLTLEQMKEKYPDESFPRGSHPLFRTIREQGEKREIPGLIYTIGEFANGNIRFYGDAVISRSRALEKGYDITDLVEEEIE